MSLSPSLQSRSKRNCCKLEALKYVGVGVACLAAHYVNEHIFGHFYSRLWLQANYLATGYLPLLPEVQLPANLLLRIARQRSDKLRLQKQKQKQTEMRI